MNGLSLKNLSSDLPLLILCALMCVSTSGCANTYTQDVAATQVAISISDPNQGIRAINEQLNVSSSLMVPAEFKGSESLFLLERATLLQATTNYKMSARDMMVVEQNLEFLDIAGMTANDMAKYYYSEDVSNYKAPPYERLMLNTLNIINFLAIRNLEDARVEARRFTVMESYYLTDKGEAVLPGILALGNYLAGAAFEASRNYNVATRYYSRAWHFGMRDTDLRQRLTDLYRVSGYSGRELKDKGLDRLKAQAKEDGPLTWKEYADRHRTGDVLVVTQFGMAPFKKSVNRSVSQLTNNAQATGTIRVPELSDQGAIRRDEGGLLLSVDGKAVDTFRGMNVADQVKLAWTRSHPKIMSAAVARASTRSALTSVGQGTGSLGLIAQGAAVALAASDTPDTRSWTTLPAYIRLSRVKLDQGMHVAQVRVGDKTDRQTIGVWLNQLNVINFSKLR